MNKVSIRDLRRDLKKHIKECTQNTVYITCRGMIVAELGVHKTGTKLEDKSTSPTVEKKDVTTKEKTFRELKGELGDTYGCGCKKTDFVLCPKHRRA